MDWWIGDEGSIIDDGVVVQVVEPMRELVWGLFCTLQSKPEVVRGVVEVVEHPEQLQTSSGMLA